MQVFAEASFRFGDQERSVVELVSFVDPLACSIAVVSLRLVADIFG